MVGSVLSKMESKNFLCDAGVSSLLKGEPAGRQLAKSNNPTFGCTKQGMFLVINYNCFEVYSVLAP